MRKTVTLAAAALALAATPFAVQAQNGAAKPAAQGAAAKPAAGEAPKPTPEQIANFRRATIVIRMFVEAFKSDQVTTPVKQRLIECLYANDLAKISAATGQVIKNSPTLDEKKPIDVYHAAAVVCGIAFKKTDAAKGADAGKAAPAAKPAATTGR
jgi:hypothetical protein